MRLSEILFEMSNLQPQETGLPFAVFVSPRGKAKHDARVKVTIPPWDANPEAIYSVRPFEFVEGERWLSSEQEGMLAEWVRLNLDVIIDYWEGRISYDAEVRAKLHSVGDAPPPAYHSAVAALRASAPKAKAIYWCNGGYYLMFDRFLPNPSKVVGRFRAAGFEQAVEVGSSAPDKAILLWSA